jgi:hypothetical protein
VALYQTDQYWWNPVSNPTTPAIYLVSPEGIHFLAYQFAGEATDYCPLGVVAVVDGGRAVLLTGGCGETFTPVYAVDLETGTMSEPEGRAMQDSYPGLTELGDGRYAVTFGTFEGSLLDAFTWDRSSGWSRIPVSLPDGYRLVPNPFSGDAFATPEDAGEGGWLSVDLATGATRALSPILPPLPSDTYGCGVSEPDAPNTALINCGDQGDWRVALDGTTDPQPYEPDFEPSRSWYWDPEANASFSLEFDRQMVPSTEPINSHLWYVGNNERTLVLGSEELDLPMDGAWQFGWAESSLNARTLDGGVFGLVVRAPWTNGQESGLVALFDPRVGEVRVTVPLMSPAGAPNQIYVWTWID